MELTKAETQTVMLALGAAIEKERCTLEALPTKSTPKPSEHASNICWSASNYRDDKSAELASDEDLRVLGEAIFPFNPLDLLLY